jgi:hypothetical protein
MPSITTQNELRTARSQGFCYLCRKPFAPGEAKTRDHVLPVSLFAKGDVDPPLLLPAHDWCNTDKSTDDEVIGQLVSVLHGRYPRPERMRLAGNIFERGADTDPMVGLRDVPWSRVIYRFVRGFHAALYGETLSDGGGFIYAPFPATNSVKGKLVCEDDDPGRFEMTRQFKQHRNIGHVDQVVCCSGKCVYQCVWPVMDDGRTFCMFALRIYNWEDLGDQTMGPRRGCLGWYFATPPQNSTRATEIKDPAPNAESLDPFGS